TKLLGGFTGHTPLLQISDRLLAFPKQSKITRLGLFKNLLVTIHLCPMFARAHLLLRTTLLFGHHHPDIGRKRSHRFTQLSAEVFYEERYGATTRTTTDAVINSYGRTDGKRRRFFDVKGA